MCQRLIVLLIIGISCSGCVTLVKEKAPHTVTPEKKSDMIWVEAKINKIWVNPNLDDNGDMVEGHYKYTVMTPGHWEAVKGKQK